MEELQKKVRHARRRLTLQRFIGILGWCWFVALSIALVIVVIDKYYPMPVQSWIWLSSAAALGFVAAIVWTLITREKTLEAALEIDKRFSLKERVSSTLAMRPEDLQSEAGQAVISDALKKIDRIDVPSKFTIAPSKKLLLPLAPAFAAILAILFISPAISDTTAGAKTENAVTKPQVKKASQLMGKKLAEQRDQAKKEGLQDAEKLFKKLEDGTKELASSPPDREKALGKLNDLARQLQDRKNQLGGAEKAKEQLDQLKNVDRGPADKFAQAASKGDFKQALNELKKLQNQLENSKLSDQEKKDLAKQLDQMKDKLNKLAEGHKAAQDDLKKRADQMRQAGQVADANKLEKQLQELQKQAPQMQQLQDMANKLGQCQQCLNKGDAKGAAKAMGEMQKAMGGMQQQMEEMKMIDDAMQQLAQAKDQMVCQNCGGEGCSQCNGKPGSGLGKGRGQGDRPENKTNTSFYDSQAKQKVGQGSATVVDLVDGPNIKGNVESKIQQEVDSARHGTADPSSSRQIPKKLSEHAREYFDNFREGE